MAVATEDLSAPKPAGSRPSACAEEIAPNAAKLIARPVPRRRTSPLSVFARMMAKVIRDTEEELTKSAVKARATELMALEGVEVLAGEMPSPPKSAASLPSPAARTPTGGPVAGLSPVDATVSATVTSDRTPEAVPEEAADKDKDDADVETPPATLPSPMGSIKGSPAVRVPVGHPAHPTASTGLTPALARLGIGSSAAPATPTETNKEERRRRSDTPRRRDDGRAGHAGERREGPSRDAKRRSPPRRRRAARRRDAREREEGRRRARDRREEETPGVARGLRREARIEKVEPRGGGGGGGGRDPGFDPPRRSSQVQAPLPGRGYPDEREEAVGELTRRERDDARRREIRNRRLELGREDLLHE